MRPITAEDRVKSRYIPKDSALIEEPSGLGTVYVYTRETPSGRRYAAIGYRGTAAKSDFHYTFKTDAEVDAYIEKWFKSLSEYKDSVADRRAEYNKPHTFQVGDIVTYSWGYDQTNVDWFRVTRTTAHYVWLKPVASHLIPDEGCGPMSGKESLALDENCKPIDLDKQETKHKASGTYISMRHGCGSLLTGSPEYTSWYA